MLSRFKDYFFAPHWHFSRIQFNLLTTFLVFTGIAVGSYLTVTKIILPKVFALNDSSKTWTFNVSTASDYTYDANFVAVDTNGAHPISGVNKLANSAFNDDNSSWNVAAIPPAGWVEVPGNTAYSTSNFLVMKYEAKCVATSDLTTGLTSPDSGYHTYSDSTTPCISTNNRQVTSVASGYPIANISHDNAKVRCAAITLNGSTAHLITNPEWMTIARNVESQATNWSGGNVGLGYLFAGHNDNSPAKARPASTTDTGDYRCAYTDGDPGTENPSGCPTNTASGQSGSVGNQVRTLSLSNGSVVWDLAGNVWEHVMRDSDDTLTNNLPSDGGAAGWRWIEHTAITDYGDLSYDIIRPLDSGYNANQGVGRIYTYNGASSNRVFLRGGGWGSTSYAGAFTLSTCFGLVPIRVSMLGFAVPVIP